MPAVFGYMLLLCIICTLLLNNKTFPTDFIYTNTKCNITCYDPDGGLLEKGSGWRRFDMMATLNDEHKTQMKLPYSDIKLCGTEQDISFLTRGGGDVSLSHRSNKEILLYQVIGILATVIPAFLLAIALMPREK